MKTLSSAIAAAALAFLSGPSFAQHAGGVMASPGAHGGGHPAIGPVTGSFGRFGSHFQQPDWYSGGWPDRPQNYAPSGFSGRHGIGSGGPHHHPGGHHGHRWHRGASWGYGIGYAPFWGYGSWENNGGYVLTEPSADMFGFFGAGGDVAEVGGSAVYDYDRSYPYDWYRGPPAGSVQVHRIAQPRCEVQMVPDGKGGGMTSVRVCRH